MTIFLSIASYTEYVIDCCIVGRMMCCNFAW
jgi:hypothetical protein